MVNRKLHATYVVLFLLEDARARCNGDTSAKRADRCRHNNASTLSNDLCRNDACPRQYLREM